jgi:hypothetical protein
MLRAGTGLLGCKRRRLCEPTDRHVPVTAEIATATTVTLNAIRKYVNAGLLFPSFR